MKTALISFALCLLVLLGLSYSKEELPIFGQITEFSFNDSDNSIFSSDTLKNKVWLFNLFFTSCQGPCPLITANLKTAYQEFINNSDFEIVSVSVDPQRDTTEKLLAYAKRFNVNPKKWHFVVGPEEKTREVALSNFNLGTPDDAKIHTNRVVLIDKKGNIRGYYMGIVPEDLEKLKRDIKNIL